MGATETVNRQRPRAPEPPTHCGPMAASAPAFANEFMKYIDATPTPFHLCHETAARLTAAGFSERDPRPPPPPLRTPRPPKPTLRTVDR